MILGTVVCALAIGASIVNPDAGDAAAVVIMGVAAVALVVFGINGMVRIARSLRANPLGAVLAIVVSGWHLVLMVGIGLLLGLAVLWTIGFRP